MHAELTVAALAAGKHVLCEARMAMDAGEAKAMLAASRRAPHLVAQASAGRRASCAGEAGHGCCSSNRRLRALAGQGAHPRSHQPIRASPVTRCSWCQAPSRYPGTPRCRTSCGLAGARGAQGRRRLWFCWGQPGSGAQASGPACPSCCGQPRLPLPCPGWAGWSTSTCEAWAAPLRSPKARRCTGARTPTCRGGCGGSWGGLAATAAHACPAPCLLFALPEQAPTRVAVLPVALAA